MEKIDSILDHLSNFKHINKNKECYKTMENMVTSFGLRDAFTLIHCYKVSKYCDSLGKHMGFSEERCEDVKTAGLLHDIGKFAISLNILYKPDKLSDREYALIKNHPIIGCSILKELNLSKPVIDGIKYHHKRHDLKGYPSFYKINNLPIEAEIVGIADAFDAMTTNRSYRKGLSIERAKDEIYRNKGKQFHPDIADIMIEKVIDPLCMNND